jgi:hypothetical protein
MTAKTVAEIERLRRQRQPRTATDENRRVASA